MKKILAIILTLTVAVLGLVAFSGCGGKKKNENTLYVYTHSGFEPFEFLDANGKLVGVDLDVMEEIGEILGYDIIVSDIEFNNIFTEVQNGKNAVGAAGITQKASRDEIALATIPYFSSTQYVIAPKGTFTAGAKVTVEEIIAKAGSKKVGVQTGTTGADLVKSVNDTITISYDNAIIASGDIGSTVASVVIDKMPAKSICASNANFEYWEIDAEVESYVLYFNKSQADMVTKVNAILQTMIDDGVIDYLVAKHSHNILPKN